MLTRFMLIVFLLCGSVPNRRRLSRWVKNWKSLVKPGAYDFVPSELSFELRFSEEFQNKVENEKALPK